MKLRWMVSAFACAGFSWAAVELAQTGADEARLHVMSVCASCHCLDFHVTPRSAKAWELTVANMRVYAQNSALPFSEADAARATEYLASNFGEHSTLDPIKHFGGAQPPAPALPVEAAPPPPPAPAAAAPAPAPDRVAPLAREGLPPAVRARLEAHAAERPRQPLLKRVAEAGGYASVACALALLASGHGRRRLGRRFRPLHSALALGLFLSLAAHATLYLGQFGTPPVLWYWFGLASFLVLVLAQLQGLVRKRFGRVFLLIHVAAGYFGLTLATLHWIWAWF